MRIQSNLFIAAVMMSPLSASWAQYTDVPAVSSPTDNQTSLPDANAPATTAPTFPKEQIAQLVAPLALYPDTLLTQILMASTYPLEVVQADRFVKANTGLKGDDLAKQLEQQPWDASVKSLVNFPQVLAMMSDQLDTTVQLGNAFLAQQQDVLAAVQDLRQRAQTAGNLRSNEQVNVQPLDNSTGSGDSGIAITPTQDDLAYVPNYDPTTIYGAWPYPNYSPYTYAPAGYGYGNLVYGSGIGFGVPWGYAFGRCDWHHRWIDYDFDRNSRYNHFIDRNHIREHYEHVFAERADSFNRRGDDHAWIHDPRHRDGVPYPNARDAQRFGDRQRFDNSHARDAYRGRDDAPTVINNNTVIRNDNQRNPRVDNSRSETRIDSNRTTDDNRKDDRTITIRRGDANRQGAEDHANPTVTPRATPEPSEIERSAAEERAAAERGRESRAVAPPSRPPSDHALQGRSDPAPRGDPGPRSEPPAVAAPRIEHSAAPAAPTPRADAPSGGRSAAPAAPSDGGSRRGR